VCKLLRLDLTRFPVEGGVVGDRRAETLYSQEPTGQGQVEPIDMTDRSDVGTPTLGFAAGRQTERFHLSNRKGEEMKVKVG
jgi:hypothetical protein